MGSSDLSQVRSTPYVSLQEEEGSDDERHRYYTTKSPSPQEISRFFKTDARRHILPITLLLSILLVIGSIYSSLRHPASSSVLKNDSFLELMQCEVIVAEKMILKNIGPSAGAEDGIVIASPSRKEHDDLPDYYYTWTRDSALVFSTLHSFWLPVKYPIPHRSTASYATHEHRDRNASTTLYETLFRAYIASQTEIQTTPNPSGDLRNGGLNEPKFEVNGDPFDGDWGRPQRDGPALRALAIIPYVNYLLDRSWPADIKYIKDTIYDPEKLIVPGNIIKNDLEEVAHGWWKGGFDLWEEVDGHHLFTLLVSIQALRAGSLLAMRLRDGGAAQYYDQQAEAIGKTIEQFWNEEEEYYLSSLHQEPLNHPFKRSKLQQRSGTSKSPIRPRQRTWPSREWKDCSIPLTIIHASDTPAKQGNATVPFDPIDPRVISTMYQYILSFKNLYEINGKRDWVDGWAMGRYKEDVYDGVGTSTGHPCALYTDLRDTTSQYNRFICTHSVAQVLYLASDQYQAQGHIVTHNLTIPFWSNILAEGVVPGERWKKGSGQYKRAIRRLREVGDKFLGISMDHWSEGGRMSEQIDRDEGRQRGARDLTWSYASFLSAARARQHGNIHD